MIPETLIGTIIRMQDIVSIYTLKSMYDNDSIAVKLADYPYECFYIKVEDILRFNHDSTFKVTKKRTRFYLEIQP